MLLIYINYTVLHSEGCQGVARSSVRLKVLIGTNSKRGRQEPIDRWSYMSC